MAEALGGAVRFARVDAACNASAQAAQQIVRLRLREPAGRDGRVDVLLHVRDQRVDQPGRRLAVRLRDLRKRLASLELGAQLILGDSEIARRGVEAVEVEVTELATRSGEEREVPRVDALLQRVAFGPRDPARCNRSIDAIAKRLLQCVTELARGDSELLRGVVQDRLVLLGRSGVGGGDRNAAAGGCE